MSDNSPTHPDKQEYPVTNWVEREKAAHDSHTDEAEHDRPDGVEQVTPREDLETRSKSMSDSQLTDSSHESDKTSAVITQKPLTDEFESKPNPSRLHLEQVQSVIIPPEVDTTSNDTAPHYGSTYKPEAKTARNEDRPYRQAEETHEQADDEFDHEPLALTPVTAPHHAVIISHEDRASIDKRAHTFFQRYHRSGGLTGDETIEERRLGGVLPFIGMLGFDVFDRTEVKVVGESRYLVGHGNDHFIVALDQAGGMPDDIIIATNGHKFELKIQGDDSATTVALLEINRDTHELPRLFQSLTREGSDHVHLRAMAAHGALEDVLREVILDELRQPSNDFREAIAKRLHDRGYDHSALLGLTTVGHNIAEDAIAGQNDAEEGPGENDRQAMKPDEAQAFARIKATLGAFIDPERVIARIGASYTAVLLDDNNRRSIARLYYNASTSKYLATLVARETSVGGKDKIKADEMRHLLNSPSDIERFAEKIIARLKEVEPSSVP